MSKWKKSASMLAAVLMLVSVFAAVIPGAANPDLSVSIGSGEAAPDGTTTVLITINNIYDRIPATDNITSVGIYLYFDPDVVHFEGAVAGSGLALYHTPPATANANGEATMGGMNYLGEPGNDIDFATVTLKAVGNETENCTLGLWVEMMDAYTTGSLTPVPVYNGTFNITAGPDTTPPVISNVNCSDITTNSATITWDTNEESDSLVKYGTASEVYTEQEDDAADVTSHSIGLTELTANTTYYYVVNSTDQSDNSAESIGYNFTTVPDTTPPVISNVDSSDVTTNSATITWDTGEIADSLVKYGTASGVYTEQEYNAADVTPHSIGLTELAAKTTYYYVVNSTDPSGNSAESAEDSFTTMRRPSGGGGVPRDSDGDGYSDIQEMIAGTDKDDPCDPNPECAACIATKPAETPTAEPTAAPTAAPTAIPTAAPTAIPTAAPTATPEEPGFEAVFAIAGLLAVAYLVLRRKSK